MKAKQWVDAFLARIEPIICDRPLTQSDVWDRHGPLVWRAPGFQGEPSFYPVYRWGDFYSHSPLALVATKGVFTPDPRAVAEAGRDRFDYVPANIPPDSDLVRIGGPHGVHGGLSEIEEFVAALVVALKTDIAAAEARHPGYRNLVLCGGKDSLNLLLLPWSNPVTAISAQPNYPLVKRFVVENELPIEVVALGDPYDADLRTIETALALGRADLQHWRWGGDLMRIAASHDHRALFWKGQLADLYTTAKWRKVAHRPGRFERYARAAYARAAPRFPALDRLVGGVAQARFAQVSWTRCAVLQGAHMDFIRELTGVLPLSAYHGPAMMAVIERAVLPPLTRRDIRFDIGAALLGRPVRYPTENPAPPPSSQRQGCAEPSAVAAAVATVLPPEGTSGYRFRAQTG